MTIDKKFYKTLFFVAVPITLQNLMQSMVNMLDSIMVGQLGSLEIAAVGLGNQIFFILNMILFGIASGGSIFIAQYWGKKDVANIRKTLGLMISFSLIISALFTVALQSVQTFIISFWHTVSNSISHSALLPAKAGGPLQGVFYLCVKNSVGSWRGGTAPTL